MAKIPFNVDAYTAKLIGRENVSKLDGAILELVKNTYDADASICLLYYEKETDTYTLMYLKEQIKQLTAQKDNLDQQINTFQQRVDEMIGEKKSNGK